MSKPNGRPPIPDDIKILEGTFRPDMSGPIETHVLATGEPVPPKRLKGEALKFWKQIVPGLVSMGVAREMDSPTLAILCEWHARYVKFSKRLDEMIDLDEKAVDQKLMNSAMILVKRSWESLDTMAAKFGLTPVDRARLRVEPKKTEGVAARKRG